MSTNEPKPITRLVQVTVTREIRVHLPASFGAAEYLADFSRDMWPIAGVDDVAKYAARMAGEYGDSSHDYLRRLVSKTNHSALKGRGEGEPKGVVLYEIVSDEYEEEILEEG